MAIQILRPRNVRRILLLAIALSAVLVYIVNNHYQLQNTISYATRPLWDTADGPKDIIPHLHYEGMAMDGYTCEIHGWAMRPVTQNVVILDAVLMSSELDLLEIRMHELDSVVEHFFIVESNATFTGNPKQTYFADNRERFSAFESKIVYRFLPGYALRKSTSESAWTVESRTRDEMTNLLESHVAKYADTVTTLVLMSDVDEIPSSHTLKLLRACDFGKQPLHLQMRNYIYSFEWFLGFTSWRASVHIWKKGLSEYRHSLISSTALADAGWHCSYCFRTISEYIVKMQGFSHADRIGGNARLLDPIRIQETICSGKEIFGMLPEAYSYVDLLNQLNLEPYTSAVGIPRHVIQNAPRFRFLLPGGCIRHELN